MQLADYVKEQGRGAMARLSRQVGAHVPDVSDWVAGKRPIPAHFAVRLEKATNGQVPADESRPDVVWVRVKRRGWPHPDGAPVIDVGATV